MQIDNSIQLHKKSCFVYISFNILILCHLKTVHVIILSLILLQNDVEIPIPKFFINERYDVLKEREKLLGKILAKIGPQEKEDVSIEKQNHYFIQVTG